MRTSFKLAVCHVLKECFPVELVVNVELKNWEESLPLREETKTCVLLCNELSQL